jgi:hypothetical protein
MAGRAPLPDWYDDLPGSLDAAWRFLEGGVHERQSPAHHPLIATIGLDGAPRSRVMILRAVDPLARSLRVHTDIRSDKVAEIAADPRIAATIYDPAQKVQLRLAGRAEIHHWNDTAELAWQASQRMSRACYSIAPASGSEIGAAGAYTMPDSANIDALASGYANFAAVVMTIESLEWLYLAFEGHRRARFTWDHAGALQSGWRVP